MPFNTIIIYMSGVFLNCVAPFENSKRNLTIFCSNYWRRREMAGKAEEVRINMADDFYERTKYSNFTDNQCGKYIRIEMPTKSAFSFYIYKHVFQFYSWL
jgi:hypothetical protein